jgi:RNA polymerase sigma-70 factor (ECF subfamily)
MASVASTPSSFRTFPHPERDAPAPPLDPAMTDRSDPLAPVARAVLKNDAAATRTLLTAVGPTVVAILEGLLGRGHPDVEDLTQECFVAFVRALPDFRYESSVTHFARRIALRRAAAVLRHHRAERRSSDATVLRDDVGDVVESPDASPHSAVVTRRRMELFCEILVELPEEQAEALALKLVLGYSVEEIASLTRVPINTVRGRLRTAKDRLRARIVSEARLAELKGGPEP